jgi:hypothetical protein
MKKTQNKHSPLRRILGEEGLLKDASMDREGPGLAWEIRGLETILKRLKVPPKDFQAILDRKYSAISTPDDGKTVSPDEDGWDRDIAPLIQKAREGAGLPPAQKRSLLSAYDKWVDAILKAQYKLQDRWYREQSQNRFRDPYQSTPAFWD